MVFYLYNRDTIIYIKESEEYSFESICYLIMISAGILLMLLCLIDVLVSYYIYSALRMFKLCEGFSVSSIIG